MRTPRPGAAATSNPKQCVPAKDENQPCQNKIQVLFPFLAPTSASCAIHDAVSPCCWQGTKLLPLTNSIKTCHSSRTTKLAFPDLWCHCFIFYPSPSFYLLNSTPLAWNNSVDKVKNLLQVWIYLCSVPWGRSETVWVKDFGNIWHWVSKWKSSISSFSSLVLESSCLEEQ